MDILLYDSLDNIISKCNNDLIIAKSLKTEGYFFTIDRLYNAFIFCKAGNPLIKKCITNIMKIENKDLENNYKLILYVMQKNFRQKY